LTPPRAPLSALERALFALSLAAACLYPLVLRSALPGSIALAVKGTTVGALALLAWARRRELAGGAWLAVALSAHTAGDVLLARAFLAGVAAFFVGHLVYLTLFWRERRALDDVGGDTKLALGVVALTAAGFLALFAGRFAGAERVAIPVYVGALVVMAGSALVCRRGRPWVPAGAVLYVASDALLSLELFGRGAGGAGWSVWPLYVAAQLAIVRGWCFGDLELPAGGDEASEDG
jgi:uncharacterized membrane protein YhhN